jgi:hypothetical protein
MITLGSVREYISSLGITEDEHVYMGTLDTKKEKSLGVYNSKHQYSSHRALGGPGSGRLWREIRHDLSSLE